MARLLLVTDSNFVNNIGVYGGRKIKDLEVKSCQSRRSALTEISTVEEGIVVVACLDMIAADIAKSTISGSDNAIEMYINQLIYKMVEKVDDSDGRLAFGIMAPLFWTSHAMETKRALNHVYKSLRATSMTNIWVSDYFRDVQAGADGIHLTNLSANRFIKHVHEMFVQVSEASGLKCVEMLDSEALDLSGSAGGIGSWADEGGQREDDTAVIDLLPPPDMDMEVGTDTRSESMISTSIMPPPAPPPPARTIPSMGGPRPDQLQTRLLQLAAPTPIPDLSVPPPTALSAHNFGEVNVCFARIDRRLGSLESASYYSNVMTATMKEEQDNEANKAMLNRVTISGLVIPDLFKMSDSDKIKAMKSKVMETIDLVKEQEQIFEIVFVRHLNRQVRGQKSAVVEAKFASEQQAKTFRAQFVKHYATYKEKFNVTPVVRLATRVRIEIMHSVCTLLKRQDPTIARANCLQFIPKPVIKILRKSTAGTETTRTMTFIEAVCWIREQSLTKVIDLKKAYDRAGASFRGTLAQHFVLME